MKKLTLKELNELNKLNSISKLLKVIELLRHPINGCPWDIAQTFETLSNFPIEEAYELQNAVNNKDIKNVKEELGDLLLQIVLFSQVSKDNNMFTFEDVCDEITKKIIRRHPQIFDINYNENDTPKDTWEKIKLKEKQNKNNQFNSILDDIPNNLPPLLKSFKVQQKVSSMNFDWKDYLGPLKKVEEELIEVKKSLQIHNNLQKVEEEIGDLLFSVVNLIRHLSLNPDTVVEKSIKKFKNRFLNIEKTLQKNNIKINSTNIHQLWNDAKNKEELKNE
ncbi:nucleoside triphosphate pyrophosphohydrolase [Alphaproteobacteria bacterium]|nr:nucleoside triphosphate pyrophosphohydrolase [Alphaproteobacteria bacterium]